MSSVDVENVEMPEATYHWVNGFDAVVAEYFMNPNTTMERIMTRVGVLSVHGGEETYVPQGYKRGSYDAMRAVLALETEVQHV